MRIKSFFYQCIIIQARVLGKLSISSNSKDSIKYCSNYTNYQFHSFIISLATRVALYLYNRWTFTFYSHLIIIFFHNKQYYLYIYTSIRLIYIFCAMLKDNKKLYIVISIDNILKYKVILNQWALIYRVKKDLLVHKIY